MGKTCRRIKIISFGSSETGKSCLIKRYCERRFIHKYLTTIGIDYGVTRVVIDDEVVKANIFDISGDPVFYDVRSEFYRDTQGALLVFDASQRATFVALDAWLAELASHISLESIVVAVVANKSDKARRVDAVEAQLWADRHGFSYYEVSALSGAGVQHMFDSVFADVLVLARSGSPPRRNANLAYSQEQVDAIRQLRTGQNDYDRLGLPSNASRDDVNRAYRRLAILLHPDKSEAPGSEEAFKLLASAKNNLIKGG